MQEEVQKKKRQIEMQKKGEQIQQETYCKLDKGSEKLNNVFKILSKYDLTEKQRIFIINYRYRLSYDQIEIIIQHFLKGYDIKDIEEKVMAKMKNEEQNNIKTEGIEER